MEIDLPVSGRKKSGRRILGVLPLPYGDTYGFDNRDIGLLVYTLRAMGEDAPLVALPVPGELPAPGKPVILATVQQLSDPAWWRAQNADAVVLSMWSAPRFDAIRRAACSVTSCVVERLDTDGARSARLYPEPFFLQAFGEYGDKNPMWRAWLLAAAKTTASALLPSLID